jgi:PRTRC genetic system protein E
MFRELIPLLKQRVLMLTISEVENGLILVNVIPKKREKDGDENPALTIPLSITGKPEELDRELPAQLATFTESVIRTGSNLEELQAQHAAAIKAVEAENRKRVDEKKKSGGKATTVPAGTNGGVEVKEGKPIFGSKAATGSAITASLFDVECQPESTATEPVVAEAKS